ncbi:MAG TPA: hypothetical protein VF021_10035, partial [Longimicrobiales bacterium]
MWKIARRMERRDWPGRKYGRLNVTGAFAIVALVVILIAGWFVDRHAATAADRRLADLARSSKLDPVELVARAARANRMVFLSDIHNSSAVKQLAARSIARVGATSGLDAVIIEVGADQQPYIDAYLDRTPEDASVLLSHPRTIGEPGAATRAYLDIYHAVWALNSKLGPDQRIRIIAADLPGWPPTAPSPAETARKLGVREDHMQKTVEEQVLSAIPEARMLFFMGGLHALKSGNILVQTGGAAPVTLIPLAARFAQSTSEVYSILVDAPSSGVTGRQLVSYGGTRVASVLEAGGINRRF